MEGAKLAVGLDRILSLVVAGAWAGFVGATAGSWEASKVLLFALLPLTLIWRPNLLGSYTVRGEWRAWEGRVETDSAGCVLRIIGWTLLCVPFLASVLGVLHG